MMPGTLQLSRVWYQLFNKPKRPLKGSLRLFEPCPSRCPVTCQTKSVLPVGIKKWRASCLAEASFCPPQLHITVSPDKVKINVDCQEVAERPIKAANNITLDGYEVLGKMVRSGGARRQSATVSENQSIHLERHPTTFQNEPFPRPLQRGGKNWVLTGAAGSQGQSAACFSSSRGLCCVHLLYEWHLDVCLLLLCSSSSRCSILFAA